MKQTFFRCSAGALALCALHACSDPISDVQIETWEPEIAAPIINTSFTLRDALDQTNFSDYLSEDEDSGLRLTLDQKIFDVRPASSVNVPNLLVPLLDTVTRYNLADEDLDFGLNKAQFTDGYILYRFTNDKTETVTVDVTTPSFMSDGLPLRGILTIPAGETLADSVPASLYEMDLGDEGEVVVDYSATTSSGEQVKLIFGAISLSSVDFNYAEGTLAALDVDLGQDSIELDMLEVFEEGSIELVDATAKLIVSNEVGVPFAISTTESVANLRDGSVAVFNSPLSEGFAFDYPSMAEGQTAKTSELIIDNTTSNFVEVINKFPTQLKMNLLGQANPEDLQERFFIHRDARLSGRIELDMPLAVRFNGFEINEEFAFDGSSLAEAIEAAFVLNVDNGFGLQAQVQVYFKDDAGVTIDSLFPALTEIIASAEVDELGATLSSTQLRTEIELPSDRLAALSASRAASVKLRLFSPEEGAQVTRLYYDNRLGVQLGARVTTRPF